MDVYVRRNERPKEMKNTARAYVYVCVCVPCIMSMGTESIRCSVVIRYLIVSYDVLYCIHVLSYCVLVHMSRERLDDIISFSAILSL